MTRILKFHPMHKKTIKTKKYMINNISIYK